MNTKLSHTYDTVCSFIGNEYPCLITTYKYLPQICQ